jgi:hypothetical protein
MQKTHCTGTGVAAVIALSAAGASAKDMTYRAGIDVRPGASPQVCGRRELSEQPCHASGRVFIDKNRDGRLSSDESGVEGVLVSNGREVVQTDADGKYRLPVYEQSGGTTLFITKPSGYDVPLDALNIPQFSYHHVPNGSPPLRFGGLPASGPLPTEINFPLIRGARKDRFKAVISGDTQPYSNNEIGYVRDTLVHDMVADGTDNVEFLIIEGDIVGDDLGLYPRMKEVLQPANVPVYWVPGNHDLDADAPSDANSFDTFRQASRVRARRPARVSRRLRTRHSTMG